MANARPTTKYVVTKWNYPIGCDSYLRPNDNGWTVHPDKAAKLNLDEAVEIMRRHPGTSVARVPLY